MREHVNIPTRITKEEWIQILTNNVLDNTEDAFDFITSLELEFQDGELCDRLASHFLKESKNNEV